MDNVKTLQGKPGNGSGIPNGESPRSSAGGFLVALVLAVLIVGGVGGGVFWYLPNVSAKSGDQILYQVKKQDLNVVVVERGNLESANNVDLICEIEARSPGSPATSIKTIVPEGHMAKKGELLVEFDSASLEDLVTTQKTKLEQAKATLTTAEADLEIVQSQNLSDIKAAEIAAQLAEIDVKKYLEGDYIKEKSKFEGDALIAEEEVNRAKERLDYSLKLNKKGYVSSSEVESDELAVTRAENTLKMAREEIRVLEQYTKVRQTSDLESKHAEALRALDRVKSQAKAKEAQTRAKFLAEKATYETEEASLRKYERQLSKCKIIAPSDGMVTYANEPGRFGQSQLQIEEGASVRERQKIIRIPDLSLMQVNVKVHEAKVAHLAPGQPAIIKVESLPNRAIKGIVKSIGTMADAQNWASTGVQVFTVLVTVSEKIEGLKPGMTAEVEVLANKVTDVLAVPIQAVIERNGKSFCYVKKGEGVNLVPIELGVSNEKMVIVKSGLNESDNVVQNVAAVLSEEELRRIAAQSEAENAAKEKDAFAGQTPVIKPAEPAATGKDAGASGGATAVAGSPAAKGGPGGAVAKKGGGGRGGFNVPQSGDEYIKGMDKNGDGRVAKDEMPEFMQNFFDRVDTNGDGFVDLAEADATVKRMKEMQAQGGFGRGQGGGGPGGGGQGGRQGRGGQGGAPPRP